MNRKQVFPSKEFGLKSGLDWVYVDWKIPGDCDELGRTFRRWLKNQDHGFITDLFETILMMNPELEALGKTKDKKVLYHFCYGVVSKFNIDDIKFFSYNVEQGVISKYNSSTHDLRDRIGKKVGMGHLGWCISPTTFDRIVKELKI
jgi:hypothetical protein